MALKKTHTSRPVERLSFNSRIDIIIPFHGKYDHVVRLVESLMRYTFSNLCQICLVDDCSPNSEFLLSLSKVPKRANTHRIKCVRLDEQRGFGGALQAGYEQTENPWTLFIHSDCVVEDVNWLRPLGECLLRHKEDGVRLVCPRTNNPLNGDPRQKGTRTDRVADAILEDGHLSLTVLCVIVSFLSTWEVLLNHIPLVVMRTRSSRIGCVGTVSNKRFVVIAGFSMRGKRRSKRC